jgi:hypothetical protein
MSEAGAARKTALSPMSSGRPQRPAGIRSRICALQQRANDAKELNHGEDQKNRPRRMHKQPSQGGLLSAPGFAGPTLAASVTDIFVGLGIVPGRGSVAREPTARSAIAADQRHDVANARLVMEGALPGVHIGRGQAVTSRHRDLGYRIVTLQIGLRSIVANIAPDCTALAISTARSKPAKRTSSPASRILAAAYWRRSRFVGPWRLRSESRHPVGPHAAGSLMMPPQMRCPASASNR